MAKIELTVRQIMNLGIWDKVCEYKGWSPYILNEGRISEDEKVTFDDEFKREEYKKAIYFYRIEDTEESGLDWDTASLSANNEWDMVMQLSKEGGYDEVGSVEEKSDAFSKKMRYAVVLIKDGMKTTYHVSEDGENLIW